jgi:hypothetical protein
MGKVVCKGMNILDSSSWAWQNSAHRSWSLWDMIEHRCMAFCNTVRELRAWLDRLEKWEEPQKPLEQNRRAEFAAGIVADVIRELSNLQPLEGGNAHYRAFMLRDRLPSDATMTPEILRRDLIAFNDDLVNLSMQHKFLRIPREYQEFFERPSVGSPEIEREMKDAGNCIALDLGTAAVFHLIRAAELAHRQLAERINVTVTDKGENISLEWADWNKLKEGVDSKIKELRQLAAGHIKNDQIQRYQDINENAGQIKDLWRNDICHTRKRFNQTEAKGIFGRVESFIALAVKSE